MAAQPGLLGIQSLPCLACQPRSTGQLERLLMPLMSHLLFTLPPNSLPLSYLVTLPLSHCLFHCLSNSAFGSPPVLALVSLPVVCCLLSHLLPHQSRLLGQLEAVHATN
eukprot:1160117-Pelagomonas_calceolata.AAC.10